MPFGFALALSDKDLWNIDLLHTHLDLLDRDILQVVFKTRFQDVFKTSSVQQYFVFQQVMNGRQKIVTLMACWRRLTDMSSRRLQDLLKNKKCRLDHYTIQELYQAKPFFSRSFIWTLLFALVFNSIKSTLWYYK